MGICLSCGGYEFLIGTTCCYCRVSDRLSSDARDGVVLAPSKDAQQIKESEDEFNEDNNPF